METIPKDKVNKKKFIYSFDNKGKIDFTNFKYKIKVYYQAYGFTRIVIDKEDSWMLQRNEKSYAYIYASLKNNTINLEVYNAPEFDNEEYENIFNKVSEGNYTSKEIEILIKSLDNLLNLENKEGIAISLQGSWGIGKTFFWNQYITHKLGKTKFVNISLFGINSLEDIKKQIVLKIYDRNKISNFLDNNPIVGKFIESKYGIDASLIASNFKKDDFKNIIVCFDDFERISTNLSLSEILGFISELKEQHNCKVVLINNNDMLKTQDELNHKKHIRKNKGGNLIERFFTTQTNNREIFDKYTEKIIDVTLKYKPHLQDNIRFLKEKNNHKLYIDWELLEKLFNTIDEDDDKRLNIRLMKQVMIKLDLLQEILILDNIDQRIKNGILVELFKGIINQKTDLAYLDVNFKTSPILKKSFEKIIEKHFVDLDFFKDEVKKFNSIILQQENKNNLYKSIQEKYFDYLYDLTYEDKTFVDEFYKLLNTDDVDIVQMVGLSNFEFYITDFLKKLDSINENKYNTLFVKKAKTYITNNINSLENLDMFTKEGVDRVLEDYQELQSYYEIIKTETINKKTNSKDEVTGIITKLLSDKGWSKQTEGFLSNIDSQHHKKWMIEDREYFELIFNFMNWIKGFSGDKPFGETYENIIVIYIELSKEESYTHKMKFILDKFPPTSLVIYKIFLKITREDRHTMLRETAIKWASENSKKYIEDALRPIHEFHSGFTYYLTNIKPDNYYKTIDIAMKVYFGDATGSGPNFFDKS